MRAIRNRALTIRRQGSDIQGRVLGEHVAGRKEHQPWKPQDMYLIQVSMEQEGQ